MRWRRNPAVLWRAAPGYLVLATVDGRTIEVGGSGGDVWSRLSVWSDGDELIADLARRYGAEERAVASDVQALLGDLHAQGYVERDE